MIILTGNERNAVLQLREKVYAKKLAGTLTADDIDFWEAKAAYNQLCTKYGIVNSDLEYASLYMRLAVIFTFAEKRNGVALDYIRTH